MRKSAPAARVEIRVFATWRKDLCNINKARDNHFRFLSDNVDLTLLVPQDAIIGSHLNRSAIHFVPVPAGATVIKLLWFYLYALCFFLYSNARNPYRFIWSVIGEEPIGWILRLLSLNKPLLVFDLWDIPGSHLRTASKIKGIQYLLYEKMLEAIIKSGDVVICGVLENGLRKFNIPPSTAMMCENGVLTDVFKPGGNGGGGSYWEGLSGSVKLLYHGYLHATRGSEDAIELIDVLNRKNVQATLLLIGPCDTATREKLFKLVHDYRLANQVRISDNIDSNLVPGLIASADICICPLKNIEKFRWSMPVKLYEYLAVGKPVVASNIPGVAHIITHMENGLLFEPDDIYAFSNCVELLIKDPHVYQKLAARARTSVLENDWDNILDHLLDRILRRFEH